jgi:cell division septum initiation protein DivIVA
MSPKERSDNKALEKRIKDLEQQLEKAQMKNIALNTLIDVAETELKIPIRKKPGSKQ